MKILELRADNFKRLRAVEITPKGNMVVLSGRNAQGKSSVIESIMAAVGGGNAIPAEPIRRGSSSSSIRVNLGDLVITRRFTPGGSTLTVTNAEGGKISSPQTLLDTLLGRLTFDPLVFLRMKPKDRFDQLKGLVKLEIDLEALERLNAADFERRTDLNRDAKALRAQFEGITVPDGTPKELVDAAAFVTEIQEAMVTNAALAKEEEQRKGLATKIQAQADKIERQKALIERLQKELELDKADLEVMEEELESNARTPLDPPIDVAALRDKLANIQKINEAVALRTRRRELVAKHQETEQTAMDLTVKMEARQAQKEEALTAAKFPVPGLSLGAGDVLFNGIPLDQASTAEQLRVSTAIAMAANPTLRVLFIREGSFLDEDGLALVEGMAREHDYQIWIEKVDSTGEVGVVIEDGEVVADHQGMAHA